VVDGTGLGGEGIREGGVRALELWIVVFILVRLYIVLGLGLWRIPVLSGYALNPFGGLQAGPVNLQRLDGIERVRRATEALS
jgi:hypothetical protein